MEHSPTPASNVQRPGWRQFVAGTNADDVEAVLAEFPSWTDRAVMHTLAHCYRVRPPGLVIRAAVVRWLAEWTHEDIIAASYLAATQSPKNPVAYVDGILRRWKAGEPPPGEKRPEQRGAGCAGCGHPVGVDRVTYQGATYCGECADKQAWRKR